MAISAGVRFPVGSKSHQAEQWPTPAVKTEGAVSVFTSRQYTRFLVHFESHYLGQGVFGRGPVVDLSLKGCRILGDSPVEVGKRLSLRVTIPQSSQPVQIDGVKVCWVAETAFGVEFLSLSPEVKHRLHRTIQGLLGRPYASIALG